MQKRSIKDLIDGLIDKDGIKTEVTVTLTNRTLTKIVLALLASGLTIVLITHLLKKKYPNHQLTAIEAEIKSIQSILKKK